MRLCAIAALLLTCLVIPAFAQDANWQKLGSLTLQPYLQQDSLDVGDANGTITSVRIIVRKGKVKVTRLVVVQADGTTAYDDRSRSLGNGQEAVVALTGASASKSSTINIRYSINDRQPAMVDVYGIVLKGQTGPKRTSRGHGYRPYAKDRSEPTPVPPPAAGDCVKQNACTPVNIYFGTSRAPLGADGKPARTLDPKLVTFGADRSATMTLGRATVTVPRAFRRPGEIPLPSWWDLLQFRNPYKVDPTRHFTVQTDATKLYASPADYVAAMRASMAEPGNSKDHVFIFVHGYNVTFENALFRAAQISYDLGENDQPFGTALLFSWASSGATEDYAYDLESASQGGARHLKAFIKLVTDDLKPKHLHLIAHSMGNAALLAALEEAARESTGPAKIDTVILAAPDVDAVEFQRIVGTILPLGKTYTLYASANDRAILASKRIRRNTPRAGDVPASGPVIVDGLDSLDVSALSTDVLSLNHSDYADKKELLNDMWRLMREGVRPPDRRNPSFRVEGTAPSVFWKFLQ
jgi:esterase/lipase superfamily enzyme